MQAIEHLADYVTGIRSEDIPETTLQIARNCLLDLVGAARAGYVSRSASAVREFTLATFAPGNSTVWFTGEQRSLPGAAFANSSAGSALDVDDGHRAASGHPGAAIVPTVLAFAEEEGSTGLDVLTAIVIGYEIGVRVAAARDYSSPDWLSSGRWCSYGVAAAGAWLRGYTRDQTATAIAVAAAHAPVLYGAGPVSASNSVKEGIPWATLAGVTAVDLARRGFTGPNHLLDYTRDFDWSMIQPSLGQGYAIEGSYFKPYACCRWFHGAINAYTALQQEHGFTVDDVEAVEIYTFDKSMRLNPTPAPTSLEAAQFSYPFSLAVAAVAGEEALVPLVPETLQRDDVIEFASRMTVSVDSDIEAMFPAKAAARIRIITKDGEFEMQVDHPLGDPANPMDFDRLATKLRLLTSLMWTNEEQQKLIETVRTLDQGTTEPLFTQLRLPNTAA